MDPLPCDPHTFQSRQCPQSNAELSQMLLRGVGSCLPQDVYLRPCPLAGPCGCADNSSERLPADQRAAAVRRALSSRSPLPDSTDPLDVAAVLLQLFAALPAPLMPESVVQVCEVCVLSVRRLLSFLARLCALSSGFLLAMPAAPGVQF